MTAPTKSAEAMSAAEVAAYLALVQAQAKVRQKATATAVAGTLNILRTFDAWYDGAQITRMVAKILRIVQPAQLQTARVTDAYVASTLSRIRNKTVKPVGAVDVTQLRRRLPANVLEDLAHGRRTPHVVDLGDTVDGPGHDIDAELRSLLEQGEKPSWVNPGDPYGRLADAWRWDTIANGATDEQATAKILIRAEQVIETDIALAVRAQEARTMTKRSVTTYRRVLHPELAKTGLSCGLCIVAADRLYTVETLKELHDSCHCSVSPIEAGQDPGKRLNQDDLDSLYAAAGQAIGKKNSAGETLPETGGGKKQLGALKKVRVGITEHGELGPILIQSGTKFRNAADFAKTQVTDRKVTARAQLDSMLKTLPRLEARDAAGENVTAPLKFQRETIARLRKELGS